MSCLFSKVQTRHGSIGSDLNFRTKQSIPLLNPITTIFLVLVSRNLPRQNFIRPFQRTILCGRQFGHELVEILTNLDPQGHQIPSARASHGLVSQDKRR